ncbi:MAG TPA: regulatory protein RecX [Actinomycetota bacterium]|nr:regulatory protein RecX [Actinomycetota bacterium]
MSAAERPRIPVKDRALRLLSARSRSRAELRDRLLRAGYHPSEIESAIADLEAVGLVDDERFAREMAAKDRRRGLGRRAGLASLRGKGVDRALAERVTEETQSEDEEKRAIEVARARVSRLRGLDPPVARRRLLGFLLRRGYEGETARSAARRVLEEEDAR